MNNEFTKLDNRPSLNSKLPLESQELVNFPINLGPYFSFVNRIIHLALQQQSYVVCIANVHMFIESYKHPDFNRIIKHADIVTPDGKPLVWALKILYNLKQDRVAGMDILPDLLKEMEKNNIACYFYGGTEYMLNRTKTHLNIHYPNLRIAGFHNPPFQSIENLKTDNTDEIVNSIHSYGPCICFVILGCPKQERWMDSMKGKINAVMIGVGGALPVVIGMQKRAPNWMQNMGLEWFYRLIQEPRRLFRRYLETNSLFIWVIFKEYMKILKKNIFKT